MRSARHTVRATAGVVVATSVPLACSGSPSMLDPAGPQGRRLADLWWLMLILAVVVGGGVLGFIGFGLWRGGKRRRELGDRNELEDDASRPVRSRWFILGGGIVTPVVVLAIMAVATVTTAVTLYGDDEATMIVEVTGEQWWWEVTYPGEGFTTANEIHIPVGRPVRFVLRSADVVHSFWVPQLAGKMDMIPGQTNELRVTADEPGVYRGECAEYCGLQHAKMNFLVVAEPPADYARWVEGQQAPPETPEGGPATQGRQAFVNAPCAGCHTVRGVTDGDIGPDLTHFGSRRTIAANTLDNEPEALRRWITDAPSVKRGVEMPQIELSPREQRQIVAYLESLR